MLALETTDDWVQDCDFTYDGDTDTFSNAEADRSAYLLAEAMVAWFNDAGRAWSGNVTATWSWLRDADTGGAKLALTFTDTVEMAPTAGFTTLTGFSANTGEEIEADDVCPGTWAPSSGTDVRRWLPDATAQGRAAGSGVARGATPGTARRRPELRATDTAIGVTRLTTQLRTARRTRQARVYDTRNTTWRAVRVGRTKHNSVVPLTYQVTVELRG